MTGWAPAALVAAALLLLAGPFLRESLRAPMGEAARAHAPGAFARLSRGLTHYRWHGPAHGPVAVCVHGLTTPAFVWGPVARGLGAMGFRVLTYDLYGRGFSDRPPGAQDAAFFVTQLEELLRDQKVAGDITLLGYSMGGAIATAFAARHPGRLRRLVLLAPAGMGHDLGPLARRAVTLPGLGTWLFYALYPRTLARALAADRRLESHVPGIVDLQRAELARRGFLPAVLRSLRGLLRTPQESQHRAIATAGVPVLAIWAQDDAVIPISGLDRLARCNGNARQTVIEGAGHALPYTHPDAVLHAIAADGAAPQAPPAGRS